MFRSSARLLGCIVFLLSGTVLTLPGHAQWYAPATEYHDRAQRRFVVEMARVLAWQQNQGGTGPKVAEVTYTVDTAATDEHPTVWQVRWLDAGGKTLRETTVRYPDKALVSGPAWYRDVARQLTEGQALPDLTPLTGDDLVRDFWKGAAEAQPSRADSLRQAFDLQPDKFPARLAGLLVQSTLPSVGYRVSLDSALLARAAAWLCLAERSLKEPAAKTDALWAPLFFLVGRENAAALLWKASPAPADVPAAEGWAFLLGQPTSREVFATAAKPRLRPWALPLLTNQSLMLGTGILLNPVLPRLFENPQALTPWHDYAPFFQSDCGVGVGRMLEGGWPALSRASWVDCLRAFRPDATDYQGYTKLLSAIRGKSAGAEDDSGLAGWTETAPLINLGFHESTGKLNPVAVVTARDLLNFGWEMSGLQMGSYWKFLAFRWGVYDEADTFGRAALGGVDASEVFFAKYPYTFPHGEGPAERQAGRFVTRPKLTDLARMQEIGGLNGQWVVRPTRAWDPDKGQNAATWIKRCWLLPDQTLNQSRELFMGGKLDRIVPDLTRLQAEGGPRTTQALLAFYAYGISPTGVKMVPGSEELRLSLLKAQTETSYTGLEVMNRFDTLPPFESAQRLERIFWQRPGNDLPYTLVFSEYLRGHAYEAAKRFYTQAEPFITERIGFSNSLGPRRFTLAMLEGDRSAMREALRASATASFADMVMGIMQAAANEDYRTAGEGAAELHDRYPNTDPQADMGLKLTGFLPLLKAFKDPQHPDHGKALDYFGTYAKWPTLQWVLLQNAKLSAEDGVRFLGGKETDPERRMMVAYLLKDKAFFGKTYDDFVASFHAKAYDNPEWQNMAFVVLHHLRNELLGVPVPAEQPDLKPADAQSLWQAFAGREE